MADGEVETSRRTASIGAPLQMASESMAVEPLLLLSLNRWFRRMVHCKVALGTEMERAASTRPLARTAVGAANFAVACPRRVEA